MNTALLTIQNCHHKEVWGRPSEIKYIQSSSEQEAKREGKYTLVHLDKLRFSTVEQMQKLCLIVKDFICLS
jgi:hypothetical protein